MKLSIITINYNNRDGLRKTIESVVNQTWQDFEYIIIDGGSTDGSVEVIKEYADRIGYWVSEPDKGIYHAMNKGIDQAKGEYCLFMNSGDTIHKQETLQIAQHDLDGHGIVVGRMKKLMDKPLLMIPPQQISLSYLYEGTLPHQSSFIRTDLLKRFHYDEEYKMVSDWKFWIVALILNNCSYESSNIIVADFDMGGLSSINEPLKTQERCAVLQELLPNRVRQDYEQFIFGETWDEKLIKQIKRTSFRGIWYTSNIAILKFIAIFRKQARWIWNYPSRLC